MDDLSDEWVPPTDAEMKVIEARRERSGKISQLMGQYLLKGYKMLASSCDLCETILLQDRQQKLYCVACSEVDSEHTKDNPALGGAAAQRQLKESEHRHLNESSSQESSAPPIREDSHIIQHNPATASSRVVATATNLQSKSPSDDSVFQQSSCALKETILWVSNDLRSSRCPEKCAQYCLLIKACAETLIALKRAQE